MPRADSELFPFFDSEFSTWASAGSVKVGVRVEIQSDTAASWFFSTWPVPPDDDGGAIQSIEFAEHNSRGDASGWTLVIGSPGQSLLDFCKNIRYTSGALFLYGTAYLLLFTDADDEFDDEYEISSGRVNDVAIEESGLETTVTFRFEVFSTYWEKGTELLYTPESQATLFSTATDNGFRYVPSIQDWDGFWGVQKKHRERKRKTKHGKSR